MDRFWILGLDLGLIWVCVVLGRSVVWCDAVRFMQGRTDWGANAGSEGCGRLWICAFGNGEGICCILCVGRAVYWCKR